MRKFIIASITFLFFVFILLTTAKPVLADSLLIQDYDVDIDVNADSTFDVSETISYRATGKYGIIYREITLEDFEATQKCYSDASLQCGGFSYITVTGVYDEAGNQVSEDDYTVYESTTDGEKRLVVEWEYAPNKRTFNNEVFTWTIKYKVYGGIGYFEDYDLFYWDVFYPDRSYIIENAACTISFPKDINFSGENLTVFGGYDPDYEYNYEYTADDHTLSLDAQNLSAYEDFTILLKFPKEIVEKYATLDLKLSPATQNLWIDGIEILNVTDQFAGITPGVHNLKFVADGYKPQEFSVSLESGEVRKMEVKLGMTNARKLIYIGVALGNAVMCFVGIAFVAVTVFNYLNKGRDRGGRGVIVPWFRPPDGISPVMVGSIKDEKVHLTDITSTIINAAVRGYLKIKEISKKNYKLIRLKPFVEGEAMAGKRPNYEALDSVEVRILDDIFGQKQEVTTKSLENKFYLKLPGIKNATYDEMVKRNYFEKRPDKVRTNHLLLGSAMLFLGGGLGFALIPFTAMAFEIPIFTCGPAMIIAGIVKIIFSFFMPAKTPKGTLLYERCKGFRMFLYTAERYRMQKLTPEMFERFLPYAMVYGVEKQWAANFEDIYKQPPDWYEGRSPWTTFNTVRMVRAFSTMQSSVGRSISSTPRASSSSGWSGGGWSGGGGFSGGFSGGGGGGGGGGMR